MRLSIAGESDPPPACDGNMLLGVPPDSYVRNFEAVRIFVQSDALSSPFYTHPVRIDSHPLTVFPEDDPAALLIIEWLNAGAM